VTDYGESRLAELGLAPLPETLRVSDGTNQHYYFLHPGINVKCTGCLIPGVGVEGDGGYVIAPPSYRHEWEVDLTHPLAPLPQHLLDLITTRPHCPPTNESKAVHSQAEGLAFIKASELQPCPIRWLWEPGASAGGG
jgi:hypothetical protein